MAASGEKSLAAARPEHDSEIRSIFTQVKARRCQDHAALLPYIADRVRLFEQNSIQSSDANTCFGQCINICIIVTVQPA